MGHDEAREFWDYYDAEDPDIQAEYMNQTFGDIVYDISREWEDVDSEITELKRVKRFVEKNRKDKVRVIASIVNELSLMNYEELSKIYDLCVEIHKTKG